MIQRCYMGIPEKVRQIENPDSREFIELWDERGMQGITYTIETDEGEVMGYSLLEIKGEQDYYNCRGFYSNPKFRGQRIGTKVLQKCLHFTDDLEQGCWGNIVDGSPSANILVREGFEPVERRTDVANCTKLFKPYKSHD